MQVPNGTELGVPGSNHFKILIRQWKIVFIVLFTNEMKVKIFRIATNYLVSANIKPRLELEFLDKHCILQDSRWKGCIFVFCCG